MDALAPDRLSSEYDVVVAGAGPAGSMAALHLAREGRRVLLLDRKSFPREKVCGDGLIADAQRCLERAGLLEQVAELSYESTTASVFSPSRIRIDMPGRFLTLERRTLDSILATAATQAGATFCTARVRSVTCSTDAARCTLDGLDDPIEAGICILATGCDTRLARDAGLQPRSDPSALAMRRYYHSTSGPSELIVSYDSSIIPGYAWIFPMGDDRYNVGCGEFGGSTGSDLRAMLQRFLESFPIARELAAHGEPASPLRGAPLRCGLSGCGFAGTRVVAIGEVLGATFPFTGEGIGKSMESGEIAAQVIDQRLDGNVSDIGAAYTRRLESELRPRYRGYEVAQSWLGRERLNDLVARRANRSRYMRDTLTGVLDESVDPREAFSLGGLLRSLFG